MRNIILFILIISIGSTGLNAQFDKNNFTKIVKKNKRIAKRHLMWKEYSNVEDKLLNISYAKQLNYLPISSFLISEKGISYDSSKKIIDYIVFNKMHPLQDYYTLKNGNYEGVKSLFIDVYFNGSGFSSSYDSSKIFLDHHYNTFMYNALQVLKKHSTEFLFSVKYFRDAIWFIENKKIYLLDIKELKIYDPDDYIIQKCSTNTIRKLSQNKINNFCD